MARELAANMSTAMFLVDATHDAGVRTAGSRERHIGRHITGPLVSACGQQLHHP